MITEALHKPTQQQLAEAVTRAKEEDGLRSSQITHTDQGAGMVRHYLAQIDAKYGTIPLDNIRLLVTNLSRSGNEPGTRQRSVGVKADAAIGRFARAMEAGYPRAESHSVEYDNIHASDEYRRLRDSLKRHLDFRCQGCSLHFLGHELQGHIVDYERWQEPGMVLIVCEECHRVIDCLRRRGIAKSAGETETPLFDDV